MRKKMPAEALLFPHTRQRVLATLLLHPKREWYLSELARLLKAAPAHLHRELALLVHSGVARRRVEGRQTYYRADSDCPFLPELAGLVRKTMGVHVVLAKALLRLKSRIQCAFIHGSVAKGAETSASDVDLIVIGNVTLSALLPALERAERELGRPVNPTIYSRKELVQKFREGNHFVKAVLADSAKTFVIGTAHELEQAAIGRPRKKVQDQQGRARRAARRSRC
jgi:predicted nucleotidyltransferase